MTIALPLTDFSSGRTDPRGDTTQRESRFRRRCQSRRAGYKSDYRNIANVIFPASGCEPSCIGDSVYWLLLGSSWMKDGVVRPVDIPPGGIPFAKSLLRQLSCYQTEEPIAWSENQIEPRALQQIHTIRSDVKMVNIFIASLRFLDTFIFQILLTTSKFDNLFRD